MPNTPQYPFGYGLSYTKFNYSPVRVSKQLFSRGESITVSVDVTNAGDYDGTEIVQLYVRDLVGSVTRPVKELKGFERTFLSKGQTKTISFNISTDDLKFYTASMAFEAEPGEFDIWVGGDSDTENVVRVVLE